MCAEPRRLAAVPGGPFERQRGLSLERRRRRLEEDEHLDRGVERERLEARLHQAA